MGALVEGVTLVDPRSTRACVFLTIGTFSHSANEKAFLHPDRRTSIRPIMTCLMVQAPSKDLSFKSWKTTRGAIWISFKRHENSNLNCFSLMLLDSSGFFQTVLQTTPPNNPNHMRATFIHRMRDQGTPSRGQLCARMVIVAEITGSWWRMLHLVLRGGAVVFCTPSVDESLGCHFQATTAPNSRLI
uniref:Uncharacterized protein n=1 Tax=Oryza barthii TaxID=65489 RepID=A0A0D3EWC9_9ORYZ